MRGSAVLDRPRRKNGPEERAPRVPYNEAADLVGAAAIAAACPSQTRLDYDWIKAGVPAEKMCGILLQAIKAGRLGLPAPDPPVIDTVRMIADRTKQGGVDWDYLAQTVDRLWRDIRRAKSR